MSNSILWPEGKRFAFTIFDDTDYAYTNNVADVYAFLADLGTKTTKSVWPVRGSGVPLCEGATCEDTDYLTWLLRLRDQGFEIGYHMSTFHTSQRADTITGLDRFRKLFGVDPMCMANHSGCAENIYWGDCRVTGVNRFLYNLATKFRFSGKYRGEVLGDPLFWGDYCRERITFVRNFVFSDINTLKDCPEMPYHDPARPYVNYWFASSEGPRVDSFVETISEANQDRLESEGGACIMYAHLACGFLENGKLQPEFARLMRRLAAKPGWFVPVGTLLTYLKEQKGETVLNSSQRNRLERRWLAHKLRVGRS